MKKLLFLLLVPFAMLSQDKMLDLEVNGRDVTQTQWYENAVILKSSEGGGPYSKEKKIAFVKLDFDSFNKEVIFKSDKDSDIKFYNPKSGNLVVSATHSFVGYGKEKASVFLNGEGKEIGVLKKLDNNDLLPEVSELQENQLIQIGPKKKGFKHNMKLTKDEKIEWLIYTVDLPSMKESVKPLNLPGLDGKHHKVGYASLGLYDGVLKLMHKEFENTNDGKNADKQTIYVTDFGLDGSILKEVALSFSIDNEKFYFGEAGLRRGYSNEISHSGISVRVPKSPATGTVYVDEVNKAYIVISLLAGRKSKDGMYVYMAKYDFEGKKIWDKKEKFIDKAPNDKEIKYLSFDPEIIGDTWYFLESNEAYRKSDGLDLFAMDTNTGERSVVATFEKIKLILKRGTVWHNMVYGKILKDVLPNDIILGDGSLIGYASNAKFKEYLTNTFKPENETYFYSYFSQNGDMNTLQIDYKDQVYKVLRFTAN